MVLAVPFTTHLACAVHGRHKLVPPVAAANYRMHVG